MYTHDWFNGPNINSIFNADDLKRMSLESLDGKKKKGGLSGVSFRMGKWH